MIEKQTMSKIGLGFEGTVLKTVDPDSVASVRFASRHCSRTEDGPQEGQIISKRFAGTSKMRIEIRRKISCGIHAAKVVQ